MENANRHTEKLIESIRWVDISLSDGTNSVTLTVSQDYPGYWDDRKYYQGVTYQEAQIICQALDCQLATSKIEEEIYARAIQLPFYGSESWLCHLPTEYEMSSLVAIQGLPPNKMSCGLPEPKPADLLAGHKRIFTLSNRARKESRLCTYGGAGQTGRQQRHDYSRELDYRDCTLSARFVRNQAAANGKPMAYRSILRSHTLSHIISHEVIYGA